MDNFSLLAVLNLHCTVLHVRGAATEESSGNATTSSASILPTDAISAEKCQPKDEARGDQISENSSSGGSDDSTDSVEDFLENQSSPERHGHPRVKGINPSIVRLKAQVPFVIEFDVKLPGDVESGTADFETLEVVKLMKGDDCHLFGIRTPTSSKEGRFKVKIYSQDGSFLGETKILYLDLVEEVLKQAVSDRDILKKFLKLAITCVDENSEGSSCDALNSTDVGRLTVADHQTAQSRTNLAV
ncbi:hypothetical protein OS493_038512 [Desmophyllum pertusum]|uniref:Uncharacterized protein n=1 Tax=Desmophyllum pertusum TaxID=174260 RepID=A0A9X0D677_9CNID|nr:hypothetical protein OS493_038512 [Desmophyllum pertusum]